MATKVTLICDQCKEEGEAFPLVVSVNGTQVKGGDLCGSCISDVLARYMPPKAIATGAKLSLAITVQQAIRTPEVRQKRRAAEVA